MSTKLKWQKHHVKLTRLRSRKSATVVLIYTNKIEIKILQKIQLCIKYAKTKRKEKDMPL